MHIDGHIVDILNQKIFDGRITVKAGQIAQMEPLPNLPASAPFLMPGFVDSHVHIESSMMLPSEFAKIAVRHGTVAVVTDPHEIANVLGIPGIDLMIQNSRKAKFHFCFGAPSCVPATSFETSGAVLDAQAVRHLLERNDIGYLSEVMNYPGVIAGDPEILQKIKAAKDLNKPIDGHAPGVTGESARRYIAAGPSTDHECYDFAAGDERIQLGMKILIREGSAAKNFEALIPLVKKYPESVMFCTDDLHPDALIAGHINLLVKRALEKGYPLWNILRAACINAVTHYHLDSGLFRVGDSASFIAVRDLKNFDVLQTYIRGELVYDCRQPNVSFTNENAENDLPQIHNHFCAEKISAEDIAVHPSTHSISENGTVKVKAIVSQNSELITDTDIVEMKVENENIQSDVAHDVLKLVVYNRYQKANPVVGFIRGFGLKCGAFASTIAHDSHNIIAVGTSDNEIVNVINSLIEKQGGIAATGKVLPLPVAGLMSAEPGEKIAAAYIVLNKRIQTLGCPFNVPFMTLAFTALLVIPKLKLSDKGLFDGEKFEFTSLFA